mmetsp:Transcript_9194/g.26726  ORF Transcript_9194/g.26726 Transcript_9194/m.26726 type:complete len:231 (+) Transcript_9194:1335-2027(+)
MASMSSSSCASKKWRFLGPASRCAKPLVASAPSREALPAVTSTPTTLPSRSSTGKAITDVATSPASTARLSATGGWGRRRSGSAVPGSRATDTTMREAFTRSPVRATCHASHDRLTGRYTGSCASTPATGAWDSATRKASSVSDRLAASRALGAKKARHASLSLAPSPGSAQSSLRSWLKSSSLVCLAESASQVIRAMSVARREMSRSSVKQLTRSRSAWARARAALAWS